MLDKLPDTIIEIIINKSTKIEHKYKYNLNAIYNSRFFVIETNNLVIVSKKFYKKHNYPEYIVRKDYDFPTSFLHQPWI